MYINRSSSPSSHPSSTGLTSQVQLLLLQPSYSSPGNPLLFHEAINSTKLKMKFAITATIASLALANLGFAAPAASTPAADSLGQRSPSPEVDWKTKLGWDGKVTPIEEIGEIVSVSFLLL